MHTHTCTRARTEHRYKRKANTTVLNHVLAFCGTYSKGNESARPGAAVLDAGEPTSVTQEARDYTLTDPHFLFSSPLFSSLLFSSLLFSSLLFSSLQMCAHVHMQTLTAVPLRCWSTDHWLCNASAVAIHFALQFCRLLLPLLR